MNEERTKTRAEEAREELLNKKIERELKTNRGLTDRTKSEIINRELNEWVSSIVSQKAAQNASSNNAAQGDKLSEVEISDLGGSVSSPLLFQTSIQTSGGGDGTGGGGGGTEPRIIFSVCENGQVKQYSIPATEVE
jgi:hypothetical protein